MKIKAPNITPGEWHVEGENVLSPSGETIATCPPVFIFGEEKTNVQVIAALPDLLKALERLLKLGPSKGFGIWDEWEEVIDARLALEKAGYTIEP